MLHIDYRSRISIYEQIKNQIVELIVDGILKPDDQLPSIRSLAAELSLNVNTVKRAFSDLETAGVLYTCAGRGCFVSSRLPAETPMKTKARENLQTALSVARANGISYEEIVQAATICYEGGNEKV